MDVVLDAVAGDVQKRSFSVLKKGGILVSLLGPPPADLASAQGVRATWISAQPNAGELRQIAQLADTGKLSLHVDAILPLGEAARAHELSQRGHTRGKIVLTCP